MFKKIQKNKFKIFRLVFIFAILGLIIFLQTKVKEIDSKVEVSDQVVGVHECLFFDQQLFDYGVRNIEENRKMNDKVKGVIIPHHLLASYIINDTLQEILRPEIKKIIIIGPDHWEKSSRAISISNYDWETPFGNVVSDKDSVSFLSGADYINIESNVFKNEHSIGGILPFISYYSSNVEIIPLVVSQKITEEEINNVVGKLYKLSQDDSVAIVASVDFSHYLKSFEAERNDKVSLQAIEDRNYGKLLSFNNDYVDSPQSLVIFLKTLDRLGVGNLKVLHNTNSGKLIGENLSETTSYFGIVFW